jgi:hypothetical protein
MRKAKPGFNIRVSLSEAEGREIHQMALRENRSQTSAISLLLREALNARRAEQASRQQVTSLIEAMLKPAPDVAS